MNKLKSLLVAASVVAFNIGASFLNVFKPEKCNGSCASRANCAACISPMVGLVGIGMITVLIKKYKEKFKKTNA